VPSRSAVPGDDETSENLRLPASHPLPLSGRPVVVVGEVQHPVHGVEDEFDLGTGMSLSGLATRPLGGNHDLAEHRLRFPCASPVVEGEGEDVGGFAAPEKHTVEFGDPRVVDHGDAHVHLAPEFFHHDVPDGRTDPAFGHLHVSLEVDNLNGHGNSLIVNWGQSPIILITAIGKVVTDISIPIYAPE